MPNVNGHATAVVEQADGLSPWVNPANAVGAANGTVATSNSGDGNTNRLRCTLGLVLPAGARITSIRIDSTCSGMEVA